MVTESKNKNECLLPCLLLNNLARTYHDHKCNKSHLENEILDWAMTNTGDFTSQTIVVEALADFSKNCHINTG